MSWSVVWEQHAEDELTRAWLASRHRTLLTDVTGRLEQALRQDPTTVGESREGTIRIVTEWPIALHFDVRPADRMVVIVDFWIYGL
jgi:hypothetical protein